jgi:hypothetical protein
MGLQQGSLLSDALRQLVTDYLHQHIICQLGIPQSLLATYARVIDQSVPADLRLEMRGIADGAGLAYHDVLLLNTVPDVLALTRQLPVLELSPSLLSARASESGLRQAVAYRQQAGQGLSCASYAVWGSSTIDGNLLAGHRLEGAWGDLLSRNLLITVRHPARGNAFVATALAGAVGVWAGMNEEQMTVALSSSPSTDIAAGGLPLPFVLRQVMEGAGDTEQALQWLLSAERMCGGNVLLGDAKVPEAAAVELSAHRHALFDTDGSVQAIVRTNHFVDSGLTVAQEGALSEAERLASMTRLDRLRDLLQWNAGWIGAEKALEILKDDPRPQSTAHDDAEVAVLGRSAAQVTLFDPRNRGMWAVQAGGEARLAVSDLLTVGGCCGGP